MWRITGWSRRILLLAITSGLLFGVASVEHSIPVAVGASPELASAFNLLFVDGLLEGGNYGIWRADASATAPRRLTAIDTYRPGPTWSPDGKKILFTVEGDRNREIYVMDADGANVLAITHSAPNTYNFHPAWSPDGAKIAFLRESQSGPPGVFVMNKDGSNQVQLTQDGGGEPSWSPDGTRIVYVQGFAYGAEDIYVMNADGSNSVPLATTDEREFSPAWSPDGSQIAYLADGIWVMNPDGSQPHQVSKGGLDPAWSPDGSRILFADTDGGPASLFTMDPDGGNRARLTWAAGVEDTQPDWSPDGRHIVFASTRNGKVEIYLLEREEARPVTNQREREPAASRSGRTVAVTVDVLGNDEIFVMSPDGSNRRQLTNHPSDDYAPTWSPDEKSIAFVSERHGNPELYIMDADGGNQRRLTNSAWAKANPDWSPDGTRIAYAAHEIFILTLATGGIEQITDDDKAEDFPSWSPDGKQIVFFSFRRGATPGIYVMNSDGSGLRRLSADNVADAEPAWSPEGSHIAFISSRDGEGPGVYVMDADGSHVRRVASGDQGPAWILNSSSLVHQVRLPLIRRSD